MNLLDISMLILIGMLVAATALVLWRGGIPLLWSGLKAAGDTFKSMWSRLILGFTLGGMIQMIIPGQVIAEWLGPTSGIKGILIASYSGLILTGGPYVTLPVLASIYSAGAGPGPIIALLTSMNMISLPQILTWEIPFLGPRLALSRYTVCLVVPPLVGLAGAGVFNLISSG